MTTGTGDARGSEDGRVDEKTVPLFGSWRAAYVAVIASAVVLMVLVGLFARWPY